MLDVDRCRRCFQSCILQLQGYKPTLPDYPTLRMWCWLQVALLMSATPSMCCYQKSLCISVFYMNVLPLIAQEHWAMDGMNILLRIQIFRDREHIFIVVGMIFKSIQIKCSNVLYNSCVFFYSLLIQEINMLCRLLYPYNQMYIYC